MKRFALIPCLDLNLTRLHCFCNGDTDVEHPVMEAAVHLVEVQSVRQADSCLKLAVAELSPGILIKVLGLPAFALNDELVALDIDVYVLLRYTGNDRAQVNLAICPGALDDRAKAPVLRTLTGALGSRGSFVEHAIHRTPELIEGLPDVRRKHGAKHTIVTSKSLKCLESAALGQKYTKIEVYLQVLPKKIGCMYTHMAVLAGAPYFSGNHRALRTGSYKHARQDQSHGLLLSGLELYARLRPGVQLLEIMRKFAADIQSAVDNTPSADELRQLYERD